MSVRQAFGVTTGPGLRCWLPAPGGRATPLDDRVGEHPPGAPVAVGPAGVEPGQAIRQLALLVADGTETAAGAGVDLGGGFTSARLTGAPGDRRDAVLAALRFLGAPGAHRLGDRTAVLVALFGLSATKRVGAAANAAITEQRWAALQLASAVSDLLGPEQLEALLSLRAPDGVDPFPRGAASTLAEHLARVLTRYQRPRRLALIVSLWDHVCAQQVHRQRLARLASTQVRADRIERLRERHREHFDEPILQQLVWAFGGTATLADAARWRPPAWWTASELRRLLDDAIAATALLRFARTLSDEGFEAATEKHRDELVAADSCLTDDQRAAATRRTQGAYSHPARPGRYVHDLLQPPERKTETYVKERVAMARNYGVVVLGAVTRLLEDDLDGPLHNCWDVCKPWKADQLRRWRAAAGFGRAPGGWEQPPLADAHADGPTKTLAERLADDPGADPVAVESPHDLLWYADLADALAPFYGNESATVDHDRVSPDVDYDPPSPEPRRPPADSVPLVAAGVAQLVAFGATPPPRCRSWADLADGVMADATVAEVSLGTFPVPAELSGVDGQVVPGTELTVELGRDPRQLARWSGYMGNCIGQSWYAEKAQRGECVLLAFRARDGRIAANLDIERRRDGWQVRELRARFNDTLEPALARPIVQWVKTLATPPPPEEEPVPPEPRVRRRGGARGAPSRRPAGTLLAEVASALSTPQVAAARRTYVSLARGLGDFEPEAAVIALKRVSPLVELMRSALADGPSVAALWRASRVRPLTVAVGEQREYERLTFAGPLPRSLRALVRRTEVAPAYAMDVVARSVRAAMGDLVADEAFLRSVARRPTPELVCALVIAHSVSSTADSVRLTAPGVTAVPGFPATDILDPTGPWHQALPAAAELGARTDLFTRRVERRGLHVPAALLGRGGWPALWSRAHR